MHRRSVVPCLLLALVVVLLAAGCGGGGEELKYSFTEGDTFTYDLCAALNGTAQAPWLDEDEGPIPGESTVKARLSLTVADVKDDAATMVLRCLSAETTTEEETDSVPEKELPEITLQVDDQGRILSVNKGAGRPIQVGLTLPTKAAVGEEWNTTSDYPLPGLDQSIQVISKGKILSVSTQDDGKIVRYDYSIEIPLDLTLDLQQLVGAALPGSSDDMSADPKVVLTVKGAPYWQGTSTVNLSKGVPIALAADGKISVTLEIIEAPTKIVPPHERGPFHTDVSLELTLTQTD